jgi:DNA processing protein
MTEFENRLNLWAFLQAFQKSPYKYLYMRTILDCLESVESFSVEALVDEITSLDPVLSLYLKPLMAQSKSLYEEEKKVWRSHFQFVFYGEKYYPLRLRQMSDPPLALSYEGNIEFLSQVAMSVVGSREPHELSLQWMQSELYQFLKQQRIPVISGGARGIDQKAHGIAQILNIPTAVILPSGLAQKYPALWNETPSSPEKILFISEMRLNERISKRNFSSRNRIIAALGIATVLVEAGLRSGTLMTAHHALAEGRPVWVVPAHPLMAQFSGSLELLLDQAQIVRTASDMCRLLESEMNFNLRNPLGIELVLNGRHYI